MQPIRTAVESRARIRSVERSLPGVDPTAFLSHAGGLARGFWGRGDRWAAWAGELGRVDVGGADGTDRFARVRREALALVGGRVEEWAGVAPSSRPRLFGGFAFLESRSRDPAWRGFPAASFVLPRAVLEGHPGGCRLRVHGASRESRARLAAELDRLAGLLEGGPAGGSIAAGGGPGALDEAHRAVDPVDRARWNDAVRSALAGVEEGAIRKVVLSRIVDAEFPTPVDPLAALRFLRSENRRAHVFLVEPGPGRVFLGAAPEILAELRGGRFEATAVAGSVARGAGPAEDRALAQRLRESAKDRSEHLYTSEEMAEVLAPRLEGMDVESEPRVLCLARIQHLETAIRGRAGPGEDVLSLVEALHPTPAVCGRPRADALEVIRAAEPFDRGWYAGPVGWFDPAGDGDFVPALRSAVGEGSAWRLFSGAGIVAGSDPEAEWDETALKFEPALRALAAGAAGGGAGVPE